MATVIARPVIEILSSVLTGDPVAKNKLAELMGTYKNSWEEVKIHLSNTPAFTPEVIKKLDFTFKLADWSDNNQAVVTAFQDTAANPENPLRDFALNLNKAAILNKIPSSVENRQEVAHTLYTKLYLKEPTAVVVNLLKDPQAPLLAGPVGGLVANFLQNRPNFNLKRDSILGELAKPDALTDIPTASHEAVRTGLKTLQRVVAINHVPEAVSILINANVKTALQVANLPPGQFVSMMKSTGLSEDDAQTIHQNAATKKASTELLLSQLRAASQPTGIALIDKGMGVARAAANEQLAKYDLSWEKLFGNADYCECDDCTSVYSAASYFVELLNYLRNNNLDPGATGPVKIKDTESDISGTPLEKLFERRPDLGQLALTCANTNTILPYVDLVNEVMESYVVFKNPTAFNVADETSSELLSEPQHTEYKAYDILKNIVYPFTLPYHQPIDAARIYLDYLGTSRYELLDTFKTDPGSKPLKHAIDAEFLGMVEEEYQILVKQKFDGTTEGLLAVHKCYGYPDEDEGALLDLDDDSKIGLRYIKQQFVRRTGITYTDLVELLKAESMNPNFPKGIALVIFNQSPKSYKDLMALSDAGRVDALKNIVDGNNQPIKPAIIQAWVANDFKKIGQIIVIDSPADNCNFDKAVLKHLDGTPLTLAEYDNPQRFIRLWRKLGWTINETDKAIVGLSTAQKFIDPDLLHQLVAVKKIADLTGIELVKLLTFWGDISVAGEKSLYKRLFLTHNIQGMDPIFKADANGEYLSGIIDMDDHLPVLMAALNLNPADIAVLRTKLPLVTVPATLSRPAYKINTLTLPNLSVLYRNRLLSKAIGLRIPEFVKAVASFGDPFANANAEATLTFLENWQRMEDAGFSFQQFNYLTQTSNDPQHPLQPSDKTMLLVAKTLYDGLNAIEQAHPNLSDETVTAELVNAKASLLFDTEAVAKITGILEGTSQFFAKGPADLPNALPQTLTDKLTYNKTTGDIKITGILTPPEIVDYKGFSTDDAWRKDALKKIKDEQAKQQKEVLGGIFSGETFKALTEGDVINGDSATAPKKRVAFLKDFLPYLRQQLAHRFVVTTLSAQVGLSQDITDTLLNKVLDSGDALATMNSTDLIPIDQNTASSWSVNVSPTALGDYTLIVKGFAGDSLVGFWNGDKMNFTRQTSAPAEWQSPVRTLNPDAYYQLTLVAPLTLLTGQNLFLKTATTPAEEIKYAPPVWAVYLNPIVTDNYTLIFRGLTADKISCSLDGTSLTVTRQQVNNGHDTQEWHVPVGTLQAGKTYRLVLPAIVLSNQTLFWKTQTSLAESLPAANLMPDFVADNSRFKSAVSTFSKAALVANTFALSADELVWLTEHNADFDTVNFGALTQTAFFRLEAYTRLRNSLPKNQTNLINFFQWTTLTLNPFERSVLPKRMAEVTGWNEANIAILLQSGHFSLNDTKNFKNEVNLLKIQKALAVADKIGINPVALFDWAVPSSDPRTDFDKYHKIANGIRNAIRAKYNQTDWEQVVKPLADQLRNNQKEALMAYLLQQPELLEWGKGVIDADGLFEYFLIDVQMDACMETSRIKQAISSVQLYIQRCFLGLEEKKDGHGIEVGVPNQTLYRNRWDWMQRYRVWEANRKVFLYPENWIESNLRDDKSSFFKELESELLQKDISKQNVTDALKNYLYKVDEVANMEVVGLYVDGEKTDDKWSVGAKLHVFSRTRNAPYFFFYRYFHITEGNWYPWEKMQIDIPSYDLEKAPKFGTNISLVVKGAMQSTDQFIVKQILFNDLIIASVNAIISIQIFPHEVDRAPCFEGSYITPITLNNVIGEFIGTISGTIINSSNINAQFNGLFFSERGNGCYLTPVAWNGRLLIFFPQFTKKITPNPDSNIIPTTGDQHNGNITINSPKESWDIAIAWSEYRNGKWTQKKLSSGVINTGRPQIIEDFKFIPRVKKSENLVIEVKSNEIDNVRGLSGDLFEFNGTILKKTGQDNFFNVRFSDGTSFGSPMFFHKKSPIDLTLQPLEIIDDTLVKMPVSHEDRIDTSAISIPTKTNFYHPFTNDLLGKINLEKLEEFFQYNLSDTYAADKANAFGAYMNDAHASTYHEQKRPYALYNWELFFHTPLLLADALSKSQQFEEATKWFHYVFNPMIDGVDDKRFWQFLPFKEINSKNSLESLFNGLDANKANQEITDWRNHPFMPHLVARGRPVSYMMWVVMKYIDNLIAWGDYLFRQDTIESINQATQLYVLAEHILGTRPQKIPKKAKIKAQTYNSLLGEFDAFGNARQGGVFGEIELLPPFSNQTTLPIGTNNQEIAQSNIFGSVSALYFCIPNNPKLLGYWDTLADRLFKIRHCENIEGIFRKLPLFEPPIDPALLVKAAAQGLSISSVLNDLNSQMPNYRFYYLLQKALELCNELKSLGGAMLSAIEKRDNETISLIRAKHEGVMQNLIMEIKKKQIDEAEKALEGLLQNRKSPEARMKYYLKLSGLDESSVPAESAEFKENPNDIEAPVGESGLKLIKYERDEMENAYNAIYAQTASSISKGLAGFFAVVPDGYVNAMPLGVGVSTLAAGGSMISSALSYASEVIQIASSIYSYQSSQAGRSGNFKRAYQDRIFQVNAAGYEIKQIDKQILSQRIRIAMANQEMANQQQLIENAQEIEEFLRNKYTNEELYSWMRDTLKSLYHQVYSLAYDLAKKAEKTFRFERGLSSSNFIQGGYWDAGRDGLLAGEQLYVGLKQLETAYQNERGYDYEITKHISLRQLSPMAILQVRAAGSCEFTLPEELFDMDFPGHYKRRIKSVSISIPCIVGPYTSINASLRLLENKFRNTAIVGSQYPEKTEEEDIRFSTYNIPISAIAVSTAQNDSGMFELNFKDERYLPFEGAGVISKWRLELPITLKQFDYGTISDVIMHVRYSASEGGSALKDKANRSIGEN